MQDGEGGKIMPQTITNLRMTCDACPSQWEAITEDGRKVYIRYRFGHLSCHIALDSKESAFSDPIPIGISYGNSMSGVLKTNKMLKLLKEHITLEE